MACGVHCDILHAFSCITLDESLDLTATCRKSVG